MQLTLAANTCSSHLQLTLTAHISMPQSTQLPQPLHPSTTNEAAAQARTGRTGTRATGSGAKRHGRWHTDAGTAAVTAAAVLPGPDPERRDHSRRGSSAQHQTQAAPVAAITPRGWRERPDRGQWQVEDKHSFFSSSTPWRELSKWLERASNGASRPYSCMRVAEVSPRLHPSATSAPDISHQRGVHPLRSS